MLRATALGLGTQPGPGQTWQASWSREVLHRRPAGSHPWESHPWEQNLRGGAQGVYFIRSLGTSLQPQVQGSGGHVLSEAQTWGMISKVPL